MRSSSPVFLSRGRSCRSAAAEGLLRHGPQTARAVLHLSRRQDHGRRLKMRAASIEPSTPHTLFSLVSLSSTYDLAPDGKRFLVSQAARDLTPPEVIVN